jgi:hypothetical protein
MAHPFTVSSVYLPREDYSRFRIRRRPDYLVSRLPICLELLGVWLYV